MDNLSTKELQDMLDNWQNQLAYELEKGYNNSHAANFAKKLVAICNELLTLREQNGKEDTQN
jgi:hypothetical protein